MGRYYGEDQVCYDVPTPRAPDKTYAPAQEDSGKAQLDGYTVIARRPFGSDNQTGWMDPDKAAEQERMMAEYSAPGGFGFGGSFYDY